MKNDRCDLLCIDAPRAAEDIRGRLLGERDAEKLAKGAGAFGPYAAYAGGGVGRRWELCVCDLAWISGRAQNLVSHHLRLLRSRGIVDSRRAGKLVMYSLTASGRSLLGAVLAKEPVVNP